MPIQFFLPEIFANSKQTTNNDFPIFSEIQTKLFSRNQGFVSLGESEPNLDLPKEYFDFHQIVVLAIGGSCLGPQTLVEALFNKYRQYQPETGKMVHFLDNIDPNQIGDLLKYFETWPDMLSKTLFLVQSKSGGTPETLAQFFFFQEYLQKKGLDWTKQMIFVTDPKKGHLRNLANEKGVLAFEVPENVGGRFSVLTPIGLLLAKLLGLDSQKILEGAKLAETTEEQKKAFELANLVANLQTQGVDMTVLMPYSSPLRLLANWYTQLLSESLGKKYDREGQIVHKGLTPIPALGATDQHSQLQLFVEGPNNKLLIFLQDLSLNEDKTIISQTIPPEFAFLENLSFGALLQAERQGTLQSLQEANRPVAQISIPEVDEYWLGYLFQFLQFSVAFLGEIWNLDAFDQPGVERSKVLTREILGKK